MDKILSFRLEKELFGIEITSVKEINRNVEYTIVPNAPKSFVGLFNMRGQIVSLFNLATILGYEKKPFVSKATCIILKCEPDNPNQRGFVIDKTGDVLDIEEDVCEDPPANVDVFEYKHVKKVARLDNELLLIIDPASVFHD